MNKILMNKKAMIIISLLLIFGVTTASTLAYVVTKTDALVNLFESSEVGSAVSEKNNSNTETVFENGVVENVVIKEDVRIKNTGNTPAYIRAMVIINWKDVDGNVYAESPVEGTDYNISYVSDWVKGADGFYYYTSPVEANEYTKVLIESCSQNRTLTVGDKTYNLSVEVVASSIQATPVNVVKEQWSSGVSDVDGTTLTIIKK
ncbi:MAG: hypothetical protein IJ424_03110 [Oscillospiraceae bacterium]|nr:hypothetical protein [Oscillospiraceae bacterium]